MTSYGNFKVTANDVPTLEQTSNSMQEGTADAPRVTHATYV